MIEEVHNLSYFDEWFLVKIRNIVRMESRLREGAVIVLTDEGTSLLREAKQFGFTDRTIADLTDKTENAVRTRRKAAGIVPVYKMVDTCAAEFESHTPYFYSCYDVETEA